MQIGLVLLTLNNYIHAHTIKSVIKEMKSCGSQMILSSIMALCLLAAFSVAGETGGTCDSAQEKCHSAQSEKKDLEDSRDFKLTVVVLTMNRPRSLARLLKSLDETDFEFKEDYFDVEIHVDKSIGAHYDDCVR